MPHFYAQLLPVLLFFICSFTWITTIPKRIKGVPGTIVILIGQAIFLFIANYFYHVFLKMGHYEHAKAFVNLGTKWYILLVFAGIVVFLALLPYVQFFEKNKKKSAKKPQQHVQAGACNDQI